MSEKQVMIVTLVILVVIVLAGAGAGYYLYFHVLEEKKKTLAEETAKVKEAKDKVAQIDQLRRDNAKLEVDIKTLQERIPNLDRLEYDTFVNLLDEKRRRANVFINKGAWVTVQKAQAVPGRPTRQLPQTIHKVQYDLAMVGSFYQLVQFVNLLEQERRFIKVESLTVTPGQTSGQASAEAMLGRREMKLILSSFTYRTPDQIFPKVDERKISKTTEVPE